MNVSTYIVGSLFFQVVVYIIIVRDVNGSTIKGTIPEFQQGA